MVGKASDIYNYFSGSVDDIAIWNRALAPGEIEDYYKYLDMPVTGEIKGIIKPS